MKKKILCFLIVLVAIPVLVAGGLYVALGIYYSSNYMSGTFINGVYATGMTVEEMEQRLLEKTPYETFTVTDMDGQDTLLALSDIDYTYSYLEELEKIRQKQEPFLWFINMEQVKDFSISPKGSFDGKKFSEVFEDLPVVKNSSDPDNVIVEIIRGKDGYELIDTSGYFLDKDKSRQVMEKALKDGVYAVDLKQEGCYIDFDYTGQMKQTLDLYRKLDRLLSAEIIYKFDTEDVVVGRKQISDMLLLDENGDFTLNELGNPCLNEEAVKEYIADLADRFNTVDRDRSFHATRGEVVTVPAGTYGNKLDQRKEEEYLLEALSAGRKESHEPIYSQRAWGHGDDDIGSTYIEVDLSEQKMYYYKNGVLKLTTDVVTGNVSRGNGTPQKACYVYFKQRNRVLHGEDYDTPVDYWMAVYGHIGIHDATWRGRFGGSIYRSNGSHGCVNTPYKAVSELYGDVEVGTPVMIFY